VQPSGLRSGVHAFCAEDHDRRREALAFGRLLLDLSYDVHSGYDAPKRRGALLIVERLPPKSSDG
jgi:hypothetical protein